MKRAVILKSILTIALVAAVALPTAAQGRRTLQKLYRQASEAHRKKDYGKAIELYRKVLEHRPDSKNVHYNLACAYSLNGEKAKAVASLKKAVKNGYRNIDHIEKDSDFDPIRNEAGYKKIIKDAGSKPAPAAGADRLIAQLKRRRRFGGAYKIEKDEKYKLVIFSDAPPKVTKNIVDIIHKTCDSHSKNLFTNKPPHWIAVIACNSSRDFVRWFGRRMGMLGMGVYFHDEKALYLKAKTGVNTATHEFTHALHRADATARGQSHPIWIIEGLGSLFETFEFAGDGTMKGKVDYRLAPLRKSISRGTYSGWSFLWSDQNFRRKTVHYYEITRYIFYYLQTKGLLKKFYKEYTKNYASDKRGLKTLKKLLGKPLDKAEAEWKKWLDTLKIDDVKRPLFGGKFDETARGSGCPVTEVNEGGPAEAAGVKTGDIIIEADGKEIKSFEQMANFLNSKKKGDTIKIIVKRGSTKKELKIKLGIYTD